MIISYWDCKFSDYDEYWNEAEQDSVRDYRCSHAENRGCICDLDNKYDDKAECEFAELD